MCGIAGFIDFSKQTEENILRSMSNAIIHRGPDDSGNEIYDTPSAQVGFGFRRLSIIELSTLGHQPMHYPEKGLSIIFNGEIYNFREIRKELETLGYSFRSHSDTEVILKSYAQWGTECVHRFIGMFAIAVYDAPAQRVILFRDRAGVKPLFYYQQHGLLLFGSELKVFHHHPRFSKELNTDALSLYFQRGYISAPHTIFQHTYKLLPGHRLEINLIEGKVTTHQYWDVFDAYNQSRLNISYAEALEETERLMHSAFQYRMIADVPVGVFLSGGYDSTAVTALLQKNSSQRIKTFTIGFDDPRYNEAVHARAVSEHLGTDHSEYICTSADVMNMVKELPQIYDEPFGDTSAIPTILVSRMARKQVTVALSADGGDEIFAGYPKYFHAVRRLQQGKWLQAVPATLLAKLITPLMRFPELHQQNKLSKLIDYLKANDAVERFDIISQAMTTFETSRLLRKDLHKLPTPFIEGSLLREHNDLLSSFQAVEYKTYMVDDILQKVDRATMSVSLEGREPFLDHRLIEWVARLPTSYKYQQGKGKFMLKDIVHRYVPQELMERPKMGFGVPLESWLKNELRPLLLDVLQEDQLKRQGIFHTGEVLKMRDKYLAGERIEFQRLSYLFLFQLWYQQWMK